MTTNLVFQPLLACSTCLADSNSTTAAAANSAIFLMLACLVLVLGSVGGLIFHLAKAARAAAKDGA